MDDNKAKALSAALSQIEKQFGKGSIMRLGDGEVESDIQVVSTGSLGLDIALGIGGLARGRGGGHLLPQGEKASGLLLWNMNLRDGDVFIVDGLVLLRGLGGVAVGDLAGVDLGQGNIVTVDTVALLFQRLAQLAEHQKDLPIR